MSLLQDLSADFQEVTEKAPLLPAARYNALLTDWFEEGMDSEYPRLTLVFILQDNSAFQFPDGTPVDGSTINYSLFLPQPEDKTKKARFGRGTEWEARIRRIKQTIRRLGGDPGGDPAAELEALKGNSVVSIDIAHKATDDGDVFERITGIYGA
jgi:hypothetical protein